MIEESSDLRKENEKDKGKSLTDAYGKKPSKGKGLIMDRVWAYSDVTPLLRRRPDFFAEV